jgi:hypothetical protein
LSDEPPIFGVYEVHIFVNRRRLAARIKAMDSEQLRRPVIESSSVESPTSHVGRTLPLSKVELSLFAVFDVKSNSYPIQESSTRPQGFNPAVEPAVPAFSVSNWKTHLASTAGTQAV